MGVLIFWLLFVVNVEFLGPPVHQGPRFLGPPIVKTLR